MVHNIPLLAKMNMNGDITQNWRYFQDGWENYVIAKDLRSKGAELIVATLLSVMGKECYQVYMHLPMTEGERQDHRSILKKLTEIQSTSNLRETLFTNASYLAPLFNSPVTVLIPLLTCCKRTRSYVTLVTSWMK